MPDTLPKTLPSQIDAELDLLSCMFMNQSIISEVTDFVSADDFFVRQNGLIFQALVNVNEKENIAIDLFSVTQELKALKAFDKENELNLMAALQNLNQMVAVSNWSYFAQSIREKSILRHLIQVGNDIVHMAYEANNDSDIELIKDLAEKKILTAVEKKQRTDFISMGSLVMDVFAHLEEYAQNQNALQGLNTGFADLDKLLLGLHPSDLLLLAARPSMGKTAFALNIALNVAIEEKKSVAIFSLEMSKEQLVQRMLLARALTTLADIQSGQDEKFQALTEAADALYNAPIYVDDTSLLSIMDLRSKARRLKKEKGLDLVIIDYLQLMQGQRKSNAENRQQEIAEISRGLKALARELNIPVLALSQLSRGVESRQIKRPMLSDLRESGSLEQDADIVMFLYREDYYQQETERTNKVDVIIAKHRNGPIGNIELDFRKDCGRFDDAVSPSSEE